MKATDVIEFLQEVVRRHPYAEVAIDDLSYDQQFSVVKVTGPDIEDEDEVD